MFQTWLSDLSIRNKLMLAFAMVLSAVVAVSAVATWSLARLGAHVNTLAEQTLPKQAGVARLGSLLQEYRTLQYAHISALGPDEQKPIEASLRAVEKDLPQLAADLLSRADGDEERAQVKALAAEWKSYQAYFATEVLPISQDSMGSIAVRKVEGEHGKQFVAMQAAALALSERTSRSAGEITAQALAQRAGSQRNVLLSSVLAVLLGTAAAWLAARMLTVPIGRAVAIARAVAAGDLTQTTMTGSRDELGQLLTALGEMSSSLSRTVGEVRTGTDFVASAAVQIAQGNLDLSARTEAQAASLQQTTASVEHLHGAVGHNTESSLAASRLAEQASQTATQCGEAVGEVVVTMQGIDSSSRKIADIISVIDGIAFQTNILALNAAVEAARAGEQGRGFAVVASEVRSLAGRSAEAAKDIKRLIAESVQQVERGNQLVGKAGATMAEVVGQVREVTQCIGQIIAAGSAQNSGVGQIHQAITVLDKGTQENAALVEQTAAAAESLRLQSQKLAGSMAAFRI